MGKDSMRIQILADGSLRVETDAVSAGNHMTAEEFLRKVEYLLGGEVRIERREEEMLQAEEHHHHEFEGSSW